MDDGDKRQEKEQLAEFLPETDTADVENEVIEEVAC